jgi:hypothetical protein
MFDTAYGWFCVNEDPFMTGEYGSLDVYLDAPKEKGGYFYGNFQLAQGNWGYYRAGVNAAGFCGSDPYIGFQLWGWFSDDSGTAEVPNTIYVYWHDKATNKLTLLGGSGLSMTKLGMNP